MYRRDTDPDGPTAQQSAVVDASKLLLGTAAVTLRESLRLAIRVERFYARGLKRTEEALTDLLDSSEESIGAYTSPDAEDPRIVMDLLLERALGLSSDHGRGELYLKLLEALVPDEALILATLAEGPPVAVVRVDRRIGRGEPILEHASVIGNMCALATPSLATVYICRLLDVGLVALGPEDDRLHVDYEVLTSRKDVRAAMTEGREGVVPPRARRATLELSPLGAELWSACRPPV